MGKSSVHQSFAQPALGILADGGIGVPSITAKTAQIVILAYRRARHLHPGFLCLHRPMDLANDAGDVAPSLLTGVLELPCFRVADIVEVDAVDVVAARHLTADAGDVVARLRQFGIHIVFLADLDDALGVILAELLTTVVVGLADGDGDNPGVTLHATLVTLVDAELQRVIAGRHARSVRETWFPRLDGRGIDGGATDTGLKENGVDICLLILVEDADEVATLLFRRGGLWPVQTL